MTSNGSKVLIVGGEEQIILLLSAFLQQEGDGMQIMKGAEALDKDLPVILITGYLEIRGAVAAMRAGAHDYLAKPPDTTRCCAWSSEP